MTALATPPKRITEMKLRRMAACANQVDIFEEQWPAGVEVTAENLLTAADLCLDLRWFGSQSLWATRAAYLYFHESVRGAPLAICRWYARERLSKGDAQILRGYFRKCAVKLIEIWGLADAAPGRAA